jgi:hypothetical protein
MDFARSFNEDTFQPLTLTISLKDIVNSLCGVVKTCIIITTACVNETTASPSEVSGHYAIRSGLFASL